jgi:Putative addiction module component
MRAIREPHASPTASFVTLFSQLLDTETMNTVSELEKVILALPPIEREHLATLAWDSLADNKDAAGDGSIDSEGIEIAAQRDAAIESGNLPLINYDEFLLRTGSNKK